MTREPSGKPRRSQGAEDPAFYDALGRAIKVARADRGLERKELAGLADVSYPYLADIESGRGRPTSTVLLSIANALEMPLHELLRSAEGYVARWQLPNEALSTPSPIAPPTDRRSWFRQGLEDAPLRAGDTARAPTPMRDEVGFAEPAPASAPAPPSAAREGGAPTLPPPRVELGELLERLGPDDIELVLDLARRLAVEHPQR